jgi:hypothetical protein
VSLDHAETKRLNLLTALYLAPVELPQAAASAGLGVGDCAAQLMGLVAGGYVRKLGQSDSHFLLTELGREYRQQLEERVS